MNKKYRSVIVGMTAIIIYMVIIVFLGKTEKTSLVETEGRDFEKAEVLQVLQDNIQENGARAGYQKLKIRLTSGSEKGKEVEATSAEGNLFGAVCSEGDKIIVIVSVSGDSTTASVYSKDRELPIVCFIALFFLLIIFVGGKNGIKSVIALIFTFISIVYLFMPMLYRGYSPFFSAVLVVVLTTVVTMLLVGGVTIKSLSAIIGTTLGVLIAGIAASLFGKASGIDGWNVSDIETLVYVGQNTKIQVGGLLFAGILIASLGAVMDVAMSVASAITEIYEVDHTLSFQQLFTSGMKVGRDAMGTMSNTLILAFVGGSITTLVLDYAYDLPYLQLINSYSIGIEIMQGIAGSIGIILTVPCVAVVTAFLLSRK
ncbi:MAG: YibE/F family protein [bacterium]|nr:YibE/F family protein [bacterium]